MILTHLLALTLVAASAADPDCRSAQIAEEHCERFLWAAGHQKELDDRLKALEDGLARLSPDVPAAPEALAEAAADGGELWASARLVSGAIDSFGSPQLKGSLELRAASNALNERLAQARDRVLALQGETGLSTGGPALPASRWLIAPPPFSAVGKPVDQSVSSPSRPRPEKIARALSNGKSAGQQRAFKLSARGFEEEQRQAALIQRAHERGESQTIGDPQRRARLLHRQNGQTCAVVAAQQLLLEHGRLDPDGSPEEQEDSLYEEAVASGYFRGSRRTGGTPWQYVGNLAQDRGLIIAKRVRASDKQLNEVIAQGKMVLADVDSSVFWHNRDYHDATHSVIVTGLERHKKTGRVLGYYVNDSDGGVYYAAGRLVPAETFLKAWRERASRFVEVK